MSSYVEGAGSSLWVHDFTFFAAPPAIPVHWTRNAFQPAMARELEITRRITRAMPSKKGREVMTWARVLESVLAGRCARPLSFEHGAAHSGFQQGQPRNAVPTPWHRWHARHGRLCCLHGRPRPMPSPRLLALSVLCCLTVLRWCVSTWQPGANNETGERTPRIAFAKSTAIFCN